jgi:hypothetical protein
MGQFEQDWLELGSRVARSLHYQHPRNLRLLQAAKAAQTARPGISGGMTPTMPPYARFTQCG